MSKYLLNIPQKLKTILTNAAKKDGYTLNGFILQILWEWENKNN